MVRRKLEQLLKDAEKHVEDAEFIVVRQRVLIGHLSRNGHAAKLQAAKYLLTRYEDILAALVADRDRIASEIEWLSNPIVGKIEGVAKGGLFDQTGAGTLQSGDNLRPPGRTAERAADDF